LKETAASPDILDLIANLARRVSELERAVKRLGIEKAAEEIDKAVVKKRKLTCDEIVRRVIEDVAEIARNIERKAKRIEAENKAKALGRDEIVRRAIVDVAELTSESSYGKFDVRNINNGTFEPYDRVLDEVTF